MGEHKNKSAELPLTEDQRYIALGSDPFSKAYDLIFGMINEVFYKTGGVNHELLGFDFDAGKPIGVNVISIRRVEDVPMLRSQMLERFPMVAHVFEAWEAPDQSMPAHAHPLRHDIVSAMFHTIDMVAVATCRVDVKERTIERAELIFPEHLGGRLGVELPQRH
jgi:hypothetical protein